MVIAKRISIGATVRTSSCAPEIFNLFNHDQLRQPGRARCPTRCRPAALARASGEHACSRGSRTTSAAAGTFGRLTQTVGTTVGLGTNRQVQFAFRLNF